MAPSYSARAAVRANQSNLKNINAMVMPISFPIFLKVRQIDQLEFVLQSMNTEFVMKRLREPIE